MWRARRRGTLSTELRGLRLEAAARHVPFYLAVVTPVVVVLTLVRFQIPAFGGSTEVDASQAIPLVAATLAALLLADPLRDFLGGGGARARWGRLAVVGGALAVVVVVRVLVSRVPVEMGPDGGWVPPEVSRTNAYLMVALALVLSLSMLSVQLCWVLGVVVGALAMLPPVIGGEREYGPELGVLALAALLVALGVWAWVGSRESRIA